MGHFSGAYHWIRDRSDADLCQHHYNHGRTVKPAEDVSGSESILGGLGFFFLGALMLLLLGIFNGVFNLLDISWKSNTTDPRNPEDGCRIPCVWRRWWTLRSVSHYQRRTGDNLGCSANEIVAFKATIWNVKTKESIGLLRLNIICRSYSRWCRESWSIQ